MQHAKWSCSPPTKKSQVISYGAYDRMWVLNTYWTSTRPKRAQREGYLDE